MPKRATTCPVLAGNSLKSICKSFFHWNSIYELRENTERQDLGHFGSPPPLLSQNLIFIHIHIQCLFFILLRRIDNNDFLWNAYSRAQPGLKEGPEPLTDNFVCSTFFPLGPLSPLSGFFDGFETWCNNTKLLLIILLAVCLWTCSPQPQPQPRPSLSLSLGLLASLFCIRFALKMASQSLHMQPKRQKNKIK